MSSILSTFKLFFRIKSLEMMFSKFFHRILHFFFAVSDSSLFLIRVTCPKHKHFIQASNKFKNHDSYSEFITLFTKLLICVGYISENTK